MSPGRVIFRLRSEPTTTWTSRPMRSISPASSEADTPSCRARAKRFEKQRGAKHLRGLRQDHAFAWNRSGDESDVVRQARAFHFLHRVHCRNSKDGRVAGGRFRDHAFDLAKSHERANGVVHQDQIGFGRYFRQSIGNGILPCIAPANDANAPAAKIFRLRRWPCQGIDFLGSR